MKEIPEKTHLNKKIFIPAYSYNQILDLLKSKGFGVQGEIDSNNDENQDTMPSA
jgi:hypothetical protein